MTLPSTPDLESWFHPALCLRPSRIDGDGVFSRIPLAEGTTLMRIGGFLLPAAGRYSHDVVPSTAIGVSDSVVLVELLPSAKDLSDFLNHSCAPTGRFSDAITVTAAMDLRANDELTIDYAYWEQDERWSLKCGCRCGDPACRKIVSGTDWRRMDLEGRLSGAASPFVRRRIALRRAKEKGA